LSTQFDFSAGTIFAGDYRVESALSAGGMGAVYHATQISTGKPRALKVMLPTLVADPQLRKRFEQEARIASLIESEHVVETVGAGIDQATGMPWLAMELLSGEDLSKVVESRGALTAGEVQQVFEQLCHAVGAAHRVGVVHRDLKPENIFLAQARRAGVTFTVKVLDFGIAKIVAEASTKQTAAMGSPIWMAPEQADGTSAITPASDVWALGLIAFYLLTGKSYWRSGNDDAATIPQVLKEVLFEPIMDANLRATELGTPIPAGFDAWFAQCVVRDPSARFQDASLAGAALAATLARAAGSVSTLAFGATALPGSIAASLSPAPAPGSSVAGVAAISGTGNAAAYTVRPSQPPLLGATSPSTPPRPPPFPLVPVLGALALVLGIAVAVGIWAVKRTPTVAVAPVTAPSGSATASDADTAIVADAKKLAADGKLDSAHLRLASLPPASPARDSQDAKDLETRWATETLLLADRTTDPALKRALLQAVADDASLDDAFRKTAEARLATLAGAPPPHDDVPEPDNTAPSHAPASPRPPPPPAAVVAPVAPVQPAAPPATMAPVAPAPVAPQYVMRDANELANSRNPADWAEVHAAIQPKVTNGTATRAEVNVLMRACRKQRDATCIAQCRNALR
jgi:serine/threonine protein kinase